MCPMDGHFPLDIVILETHKTKTGEEIYEAILYCSKCSRWFPVVEGIPRLMPDELRNEGEDMLFLKKYGEKLPKNIRRKFSSKVLKSLDESQAIIHDKKETMKEFDQGAPKYHDKPYGGNYRTTIESEAILKRLDLAKGDILLDAGSGSGRITKSLTENCSELVAADFSFESLKLCRRYCDDVKSCMVHYVQCDIEHMPFKEETFDKVASCEVILHLPNAQARYNGLREIHRVLKNKGVFVVVMYNYTLFLRVIDNKYEKEGYQEDKKSKKGAYYYRFSKSEFEKLLSNFFALKESCTIGNLFYVKQCFIGALFTRILNKESVEKLDKMLSGRLIIKIDQFLEKVPFSSLFATYLLSKCIKK